MPATYTASRRRRWSKWITRAPARRLLRASPRGRGARRKPSGEGAAIWPSVARDLAKCWGARRRVRTQKSARRAQLRPLRCGGGGVGGGGSSARLAGARETNLAPSDTCDRGRRYPFARARARASWPAQTDANLASVRKLCLFVCACARAELSARPRARAPKANIRTG